MQIVFPDVKKTCSPEEWKARCDLSAIFHLANRFGWTDIIYNHFSVRIPGTDRFLIHPLGLAFNEIRASNLVVVNSEGAVLDHRVNIKGHPKGYRVIHGAWVIHGGIHMARPEINCILHTHNRAGLAISSMKCGLLPLTQHSIVVYPQVTYHDYEGMVTLPDERKRLGKRLGETSKVMILKNHGLLTLGETPAEAFHLMYYLDAACKAQIDAMSGGMRNLSRMKKTLISKTNKDFDKTRKAMIEMEWSSLLRTLTGDKVPYDT